VADLCALHATLFGGGALARIGGQVRTEQNWIGGLSPLDASFVPPPPGRVPELLHDLCAFLSDDALPPLVQAAVAHAQFETIHPFADGNGRTGRALIHVVLRRRGLCRRFVPPISLVLATRGEAYVRGLMGTRRAIAPGDPEETEGWTSWIELFASATRIAVAQARRYDAEMEALVDRWREQVRGLPECPRADAAVWPLLDWLPASPLISARDAVALTGRSPRAIDVAIRVLAQVGVLRQVGGRQRGRVWEADGVFDHITIAERALASPSLDTQVEPPARPVPARPAPPRASRAKAPHPLPETLNQDLILQTPIVVESDPPDDPT
jgi:Fic family protein